MDRHARCNRGFARRSHRDTSRARISNNGQPQNYSEGLSTHHLLFPAYPRDDKEGPTQTRLWRLRQAEPPGVQPEARRLSSGCFKPPPQHIPKCGADSISLLDGVSLTGQRVPSQRVALTQSQKNEAHQPTSRGTARDKAKALLQQGTAPRKRKREKLLPFQLSPSKTFICMQPLPRARPRRRSPNAALLFFSCRPFRFFPTRSLSREKGTEGCV